ncbi:hypothetical protein GOP47_0010487 [Adiantum capillus-veneris]|uniref:Nucleoside diphosphate kinase n=1 Tax=Adiantum capillus-veneris TaxID=13818 RepID=A0A9D4UV39_ADICA|nr:hypothetical protein GOP47_0010487 [Adiantum capillus-veneris]
MAAGSATVLPSSSYSTSSAASLQASGLRHSCLALSSSHTLFCSQLRFTYSASLSHQCGRLTPIVRASQSSTERSYVMIKPDGVQRGLVGEIISRFERKGFTIKGLKLFSCPAALAEEHYKDLSSKPFYPKLVKYITSGPVVCLALEGPGVVASARKLIGVTNPLQAEPGTIRGDLGIETGRNVIHGSDSPENGEREIALWFKEGELCEWEPTLTPWLRE